MVSLFSKSFLWYFYFLVYFHFTPSCFRLHCPFSSVLKWKIRLLIWGLSWFFPPLASKYHHILFFNVNIYNYKFYLYFRCIEQVLACVFIFIYLKVFSISLVMTFDLLVLFVCCLIFTYLCISPISFCYQFLILFYYCQGINFVWFQSIYSYWDLFYCLMWSILENVLHVFEKNLYSAVLRLNVL